MPWREHVGSTSASTARTRIEYGGCSVTKRCRPPVARDPLRLDDLAGGEGGGADVADLALMHEVAERRERLVDVGPRVGAVDLVEVDPVGAQPPQRVLDRTDDPAPRVALLVGVLAHRVVELGGEDDVVAPAAGERLADDLLGLALRRRRRRCR